MHLCQQNRPSLCSKHSSIHLHSCLSHQRPKYLPADIYPQPGDSEVQCSGVLLGEGQIPGVGRFLDCIPGIGGTDLRDSEVVVRPRWPSLFTGNLREHRYGRSTGSLRW